MIMPNLMTRGRRDVCMSGNDRIRMADILAGIFHFADRSGMAQMTAGKDRHLWENGENRSTRRTGGPQVRGRGPLLPRKKRKEKA